MSKLTDELRKFMLQEGITQAELSDRTKDIFGDEHKVSQATISRILNEKQTPTIEILDKLARVMNVDVMELAYWQLGRQPQMSPDIVERLLKEVTQLGDQYQIIADIFFLSLANLSNRERLETVTIILKQPNKQPGEL